MTNNTLTNRRAWLKNSFMGTIGLAFLPKSKQEEWINQQASFTEALQANDPISESYWKLVKNSFPLLPGLHYFNNASLGPSPKMVVDATNQYRALLDGFPSKYMWGEWKEPKEKVRENMATLLKVSPETIALTHNTTEGMNIVASSLELNPGDEVILGNHEHHTGTIPWKYHQEQLGISLVRPTLPILPKNMEELVEIYRKAITPKTKVISMVHMTNTNGMIMPVKAISQMAHEQGILVVIDGAQTVGMLDLDLQDLECDFFAGSCHKWLFGPKGMGVFYARTAAQQHLKAMIVCAGYQDESIRRLENYNTRNLPELLGVGAALDFHHLIGASNRVKRMQSLKSYFRSQLEDDDRFRFKTPADDQCSCGIITVELVGKDVKTVKAQLFGDHQIDCRPMSTHGLNGLRISLAIYHTKRDVDKLVGAIKVIADS